MRRQNQEKMAIVVPGMPCEGANPGRSPPRPGVLHSSPLLRKDKQPLDGFTEIEQEQSDCGSLSDSPRFPHKSLAYDKL